MQECARLYFLIARLCFLLAVIYRSLASPLCLIALPHTKCNCEWIYFIHHGRPTLRIAHERQAVLLIRRCLRRICTVETANTVIMWTITCCMCKLNGLPCTSKSVSRLVEGKGALLRPCAGRALAAATYAHGQHIHYCKCNGLPRKHACDVQDRRCARMGKHPSIVKVCLTR